ncbi:MAG: hypothetical protein V2I57_16205 [Xanthomonadales bacterium]|jgi:hypothetical protein|nr:hypothetical protein [Xanthomonadales bacterium]
MQPLASPRACFPAAKVLLLFSFITFPAITLAQDPGVIEFPDRSEIDLGAETERALDRSGSAHVETVTPSGVALLDHNGAMQNVTVARLGPDGKIDTLCTSNREEALDFLAGLDRADASVTRSVAPDATVR